MLSAPRFHHLHLNSVDPEAAIAFYTRFFPSTSRTEWCGQPALASPNNVLVLFNRVAEPPATAPETALWHFGWHVTDSREALARYRASPDLKLLPLYTSDNGESVLISSDAWPGVDGVLGRTRAQVAEARATGVKPKGGAGFAYMEGPDGALVEYAGDHPAERFNHVHLWQDEPFCAQLWYQKHLDAAPMEGRTSPVATNESNCRVMRGADRSWPSLDLQGTFRVPRAAVMFGDVALTWYPRQGEEPLASPRGHVVDHIGLAVSDLDAWAAKLAHEGVAFLERTYRLGDTRAFMIEGPSREALELVEVAD